MPFAARALTLLLVLTASLPWSSDSVNVQDGAFSFPLESVKILKTLMNTDSERVHLATGEAAGVCNDPRLPVEFHPVCHGKGAGMVFSRLAKIITPPDMCEICANAACTGCL